MRIKETEIRWLNFLCGYEWCNWLVVSATIGEFESGKLLFGFEIVKSRWDLWDFSCSVELHWFCLVSPRDSLNSIGSSEKFLGLSFSFWRLKSPKILMRIFLTRAHFHSLIDRKQDQTCCVKVLVINCQLAKVGQSWTELSCEKVLVISEKSRIKFDRRIDWKFFILIPSPQFIFSIFLSCAMHASFIVDRLRVKQLFF